MTEIEQVRKELWELGRRSTDVAVKSRCNIIRGNLALLAQRPDDKALLALTARNVLGFEQYMQHRNGV